MPVVHLRSATIGRLRHQVAALERRGEAGVRGAVLPFGVGVVDGHLPEGGLRLGGVHEVQGSGLDTELGVTPALFAASILARRPGQVLWIGSGRRVLGLGVYGPGLMGVGLDPRRVVFVDAGKTVLLVVEEALRQPGMAGVVAEVDGRLDGVVSRRLQLAAEGSSVLGLLVRRSRRFDDPVLREPSASVSRWRVGPIPSSPASGLGGLGLRRALWRLELLRCRGGEGASWILEGADAQGRLAVAAVLADGSAAPVRRHAAG